MTELRVRYKGQESLLSFNESKKWISVKIYGEDQDTIGLPLDFVDIKKTNHDLALEIGHFLVVLNLDAYGSLEEAEKAFRVFKNAIGITETLNASKTKSDFVEENHHVGPTNDQPPITSRPNTVSSPVNSYDRNRPYVQQVANSGSTFKNSYGSTLIKLFWYLSLLGIVPSTIFYSSLLFKAKLPFQAFSVIWAGVILTAIIRLVCEWLSNHFQQTTLLKQIASRL
jgi:hypothetical protein